MTRAAAKPQPEEPDALIGCIRFRGGAARRLAAYPTASPLSPAQADALRRKLGRHKTGSLPTNLQSSNHKWLTMASTTVRVGAGVVSRIAHRGNPRSTRGRKPSLS